MAEYVTLLGSEAVERAARSMSSAASEMQRAAGNFDYAVEKMRTLVERFEAAAASLKAPE